MTEKEARAIFAEVVLKSIEQDIAIYSVDNYIEDGNMICSIETDESRTIDVIINFGECGIDDAQEWPGDSGVDDIRKVYGIICTKEIPGDN